MRYFSDFLSDSYGGWFVPFRLFVFRRQIMPCEKNEKTKICYAKKRNNAMIKDEITSREKKKKNKKKRHAKSRNSNTKRRKKKKKKNTATQRQRHAKRRHLKLSIYRLCACSVCCLFAWRYFVFLSSFRVAHFRLFAWRLFIFFRKLPSCGDFRSQRPPESPLLQSSPECWNFNIAYSTVFYSLIIPVSFNWWLLLLCGILKINLANTVDRGRKYCRTILLRDISSNAS